MKKQAFLPVALGALVLALAGCSSTVKTASNDSNVTFPDAGSAWLKKGAFVDVEQLRRIGIDMSKNQVRELISYPHFSEGLFGVTVWNYLFNFRTGKGNEYVTCQYQVQFKDGLSNAMHWKDPACALYVNPPVVKPIPVVAAAPKPPEKVTLGADGLFRFDGSSETDLLPEGERRIRALATEIKRNFKALNYVLITGHTDRLGSDGYNERLSLARANTVRTLLVREGLDGSRVRTAGMGKRQPVVSDCPAGVQATPELVSCLQANRRVEIEVSGEQ